MYEDILKFLKSKNRKLTKEEASEFIKLLAESVGVDEDFIFSSNNFDNLEDDFSTDINFVVDTYNGDFSDYEDSLSLEGISDEEEEEKDYVVLNKRKIIRNLDFKKRRALDIKQSHNKLDRSSDLDTKKLELRTSDDRKYNFDTKKIEEEKQSELFTVENTNFNFDIENKEMKSKSEISTLEETKKINVPLLKETELVFDDKKNGEENLFFNLPKKINFSTANFLPPDDNESFKLQENFKFELPKKEEEKFPLIFDENQEYKFDIGDLVDTKKSGPDYKFYDEDQNEI